MRYLRRCRRRGTLEEELEEDEVKVRPLKTVHADSKMSLLQLKRIKVRPPRGATNASFRRSAAALRSRARVMSLKMPLQVGRPG